MACRKTDFWICRVESRLGGRDKKERGFCSSL
jgi:hypothetical protein